MNNAILYEFVANNNIQKNILTLLLIENDEVDALAVVRHISKERLPYHITLARSIGEARRILSEADFDIIVADYDLPDGNAFDIQDKFTDQIVIFLTGAGNEEIASRAFKIGVCDYLIKEPEQSHLRLLPNRIDALMQQRYLSMQLKERLKEMTCLYKIRRSLDLSLSIEEICKLIIENLAAAMQFPLLSRISIRIDKRQFPSMTSNHKTMSALNTRILVKDKTRGQLSVHYCDNNALFIPEEQDLINAIAEDLGWWLERKENEENLRIAAVALESSDGVIITDAKGKIVRINSAFTKLTGYCAEDIQGKSPALLQSEYQEKQFFENMWGALSEKDYWNGELHHRRKDGTTYPAKLSITAVKNTANQITHYVGIFQDISSKKEAENLIHNLSFYDSLTTLPNRRLLVDRMNTAIAMSKDNHDFGALILIDIDHFKSINDVFGHNTGDRILYEFARHVMSYCVRKTDTVARFGGDEFAILLTNLGKNRNMALQKAGKIAEKMRKTISDSYFLNKKEFLITPSIGISLFNGDDTAHELIKVTDAAMYQAKESGRNRISFFDPLIQKEIEERTRLEVELRSALFDKQLQLYYQIQVNCGNRAIGVEALIRWHHPGYGIISPAKFIPIAEESSLILDIGQWIIDTACGQLAVWSRHAQTRTLSIAINISSRQFHEKEFVEKITAAIRAHGIDPSLLKLELTESIIMDDVHAMKQIAALRRLGVHLSLDDFGTGYSSLSYLKKLQVDQLKIDQSFVRDISIGTDGEIMTKTIIGLARNFRLDIIAEGVETEQQLAFLKENGCNKFQGYLFGRPLPVHDVEILLEKYPAAID